MKMLRGLLCIFFCGLMILIDGCSSSDVARIADQLYFPLRVGGYWIYTVNETDIQHITCNETSAATKIYELKVLIFDSTKNAEGGYTYNIHRYTRTDSGQPWTDLDTWSARVTTSQVIVAEGNTPYVKLSFPLMNNGQWNGNLYNTLGTEDYHLKNVGQPYQLDNGKYPTTVTVLQSDNQDFFVYQDKRVEVYAASIGLIYKETTQLTYFQDPCYGQQKVKTGLIYTQALKSYGHE